MGPPTNLRNLPFKINKKLLQWIIRFSEDPRPESFPYISGDTFRKHCDHIFDRTKTFRPQSVKANQTIFVQADMLKSFFEDLHPLISSPYILVSHNSDQNIGPEFFPFIDGKLIHWFAQSLTAPHPKISPLPIGLENLHYQNHGVTSRFEKIRKNIPAKNSRVLAGFNVRTNPEERSAALNVLRQHSAVDLLERPLRPAEYLERLATYKFVASPAGNSLDCIRTWEALYVRVVPIVKRSVISDFFRDLGLPLLVVKEWEDLKNIDEAGLAKIYGDLEGRFEHDALWFPYWLKKISSADRNE